MPCRLSRQKAGTGRGEVGLSGVGQDVVAALVGTPRSAAVVGIAVAIAVALGRRGIPEQSHANLAIQSRKKTKKNKAGT